MNFNKSFLYQLRAIGYFIDLAGEQYLRERKSNITFAQFLLLIGIYELQKPSVTRLAQWINISTPTATHLLKKLTIKNFVQISVTEHSLRQKEIVLTKSGKKLAEELFPEINKNLSKKIGKLPGDELKILSGIISQLYLNLNQGKNL